MDLDDGDTSSKCHFLIQFWCSWEPKRILSHFSQHSTFVQVVAEREGRGMHNLYCLIQYSKFRVFWDVAPCSHVEVNRRFRGAYCLMMSASETSVNFNVTTWRYNTEDSELHACHRENLKSHIMQYLLFGTTDQINYFCYCLNCWLLPGQIKCTRWKGFNSFKLKNAECNIYRSKFKIFWNYSKKLKVH
jgi:hypothetical protein